MAHIPLYKATAEAKHRYSRRVILASIAGLVMLVLIASELGYGFSVSSKGNVEMSMVGNDATQTHRGLVSSLINGPAPAVAQPQPAATPKATATPAPANTTGVANEVSNVEAAANNAQSGNLEPAKPPMIVGATQAPARSDSTVTAAKAPNKPVGQVPTALPVESPTPVPAQPAPVPVRSASAPVPPAPTAKPPTAKSAPIATPKPTAKPEPPRPTATPKPILPLPTLPVKPPALPTPTPKDSDNGEQSGAQVSGPATPAATVKINVPGVPPVNGAASAKTPATSPAVVIKLSANSNQLKPFSLTAFLIEVIRHLLFETA